MGIGAFQSAFQLGLFLNPLIVVWLEQHGAGSRAAAVGWLSWAVLGLAAMAALTAVAGLRHGRR